MKKITNLFWLCLIFISSISFAQTARVQVIHNSPDLAASSVDVYLNDVLLLNDFHFRTATPFIDAPAGVELSIDIAPSSSSSSAESIYNLTTTLSEFETYIIIANGIISPTGYSPSTPFGLQVLVGGREGTAVPDTTDVIVFHGSTDAPTVDVVELAVPAGTIVNDISYGSFSEYLELPTNNYVLAVRDETGTATVATYSAPLADLFLQTDAITVLASGFLDPSQNSNGPEFGLWVALASGGDLIPLPLFHNPTARLQVIHNSPDLAASAVDVYVNGALLLDNFAFRTATPFIDVPAGIALSIDVAPSTSTSSAESLYNLTATLNEFETYIIVANGIVSPTGYSPNQPFALEVLVGGREGTAVEDTTDVIVFHGSPDAPTVDVVETSVPAGTLVDNLDYGSFSNYLELPTNNYTIDVRDETGTVTVATYSAPLADLFLQLDAITVVASGFLDPSQNSNGPAFGLWVAKATGGALIPLPLVETPTARLQAIHNSADLAAALVDVYVNDELLLNDFAFRTATPFIDVPAGVELSIDVAPSTSTSSAESIYNLTATLAEGETYILVANGIVSPTGYSVAPNFAINVFAQGREVAADSANTDVLVNHGSPDAPTVDVVETSIPAGTIVDNISFPEFQGYLDLPNLDFTLDVRDETGTVTVASYQAPLQTLGLEGAAITVLASGFLDPSANSNGPAFGLWVALAEGGALIPLPLVETPTARLQAIHNSPDLAAALVDVYVNDELLLNDFAFRTATPFIDVPAGVELSIDVAPSTSTSSAESIYNLTATLAEGETYILVANGIVSPTGYSVAPNFAINVFAQGREVAANSANTDVLVNHGSPDAPTVDVVETSIPAGTIVDNISFPEFQGYLDLPNLDFTLDVRDETGTVTVASYQAPLQTLGLEGAAITVLASGFLDPSANSNGPAFGLWVALAEGGALIPLPLVETPTARLQAIHNSPDLAAALVDVYVNDELLLNDFAFRTATPFIDVPAGVELSIDVAPSTSTSSAESIYNLTATLAEGETYILVANGIVSPTGYSVGPNFAINVFAQGREVAADSANTDVLVNHGSPDAPTVDVVETSIPAGTIVNNISFPEFQGYLDLPNLDFTLDVRDETGTVTVASYQAPLQTLGLEGAAITVLASGFLDPSANSNGPAFGLWVALASGGDLIPLPEIPLNVDSFNLNSISLFPNPAKETINLSIPFDYENFSATIYDLSGRLVKTVTTPTDIDISELNSGLYILNTTLNDLSFNQKFVKN